MRKSFKGVLCGMVLLGLSFCRLSAIQGATSAEEMHQNGWTALVGETVQDRYALYAMYMARTLAVYNPEVYLKADGVWERIIKGYPGWQRLYEMRDRNFSQDEFDAVFLTINDGFRKGSAGTGTVAGGFSWSNLQWERHRTNAVAGDAIYPESAPSLPILDMRLPNLWNSMKGMEWRTPRLSLAEFAYFHKKTGGEDPYILITDDGYGYVASVTAEAVSLYDPMTGEDIPSSSIHGQVFLVMNDSHVWYPLMKRDDCDESPSLKAVVQSLATEGYKPSLSSLEEKLVGTLQNSTRLATEEDILWAQVFAGKFVNQNSWRVDEIRDLYRPLFSKDFQENLDKYGDSISLINGISLVVAEMANRLSPATALLAQATLGDAAVASSLQKLSETYTRWFKRKDNEFVYGNYVRIWLPTLEDKVLSCFGDCIVEACNTGSAMALRGESDWRIFIPNWWQLTDDGVSGGHVIAGVYSPSGKGTMSNNQYLSEGPLYSGPRGNLVFVNVYEIGKGFISTAEYINGSAIWPGLDRPRTNMGKVDTIEMIKFMGTLEPGIRIGSGRNYPRDEFITYSPSEYASKLENDEGPWEPFWELTSVAIDPPAPASTTSGGGGCSAGGTVLPVLGMALLIPLLGIRYKR